MISNIIFYCDIIISIRIGIMDIDLVANIYMDFINADNIFIAISHVGFYLF